MKTEKNSLYLLNKCENLQKSLSFFSGGNYQTPAKIRRTIFLLQIDFWDWELEELIFSFKNFSERSYAWGEKNTWDCFELFKKNNIELRYDTLEEYKYWIKQNNKDINSKLYSRSNLSWIISMCSIPKKPQRKPKPSASEDSGP